jgi:NAD(P)-dependent dehydrogenase (short-subunit alcohol dehydrogenase family)/SAM-dependent methyltransferase
MRLRSNLDHPLLGHITPDSAAHNMRWTNRLSANVLDWLPGHAVQGQIVFPASGYLTSALEASRLVAEGKGSIRIIEIHDFVIHQAVPFEQEDSVIEVLIEMSQNAHRKEPNASCSCIRSHFSYSAAIDPDADDLVLAASGLVVIHLGEPTPSLLPKRAPATPHMIDIEPDRFYFALSDLGYNFNGSFRSLAGLRRKRGKSTCRITNRSSESFPETAVSLLIHPVTLDAILQSAIVAYSYPYDEELRTLHLPTTIELMRVVPDPLLGCVDGGVETAGSEVEADASIDFTKADSGDKTGIVANISAYRVVNLDETPHASIQIQGAAFKPLGGADSGEDRSMYSRIQWVPDRPDGTQAAKGLWDGESQRTVVRLLERIAIFYLRKFDKEIPQGHPARARSPTKWYLNHAKHVLDVVASGKQKWWNEEWENDTVESIQEASAPYSHLPDVEIMHLVGERMPSVFAGNTTMLEEFRVGDVDVLDRYYAEGIGLRELGTWVGRAVKQLADRHPHMKILEVGTCSLCLTNSLSLFPAPECHQPSILTLFVGAGTGGATKAICREIGDGFLSYTYTDISAAFFETASATFSKQGEKMVYKTFDVEHDPESQGFQLGSYDLVIAFFVIHATKDMERSLRNIRKLLRPGGHLIIGEGSETGSGAATSGFIFGTLPGWWVGTESGRTLSPLISPREWNELLHKTGFSGADAAPPISVEDIFNVFPVVSQAVDDHINFLREPLSKLSSFSKAGVPDIDQLVIIGGASERSLPLVRGLQNSLYPDHVADIRHFKDLLELDLALLESTSAVISLAELDRPVFNGIKADQFTALKKIYEPGKFVFWVTSGRLCDEPYCNMTAAFGRVATHETADLQLQTFDIPSPLTINPQFLAEAFLRAYGALATKEKVDRFWAIEPEIVAGNQGGQLVPRLQFIPELNDRYNAGRRPISCDTDVSNSPVPVALQAKDTGYVLTELSPYQYSLTGVNDEIDDLLELTTIFSTLSAIKSPVGHNFLILGRDFRTDRCYLAFTSSIASTVKVPSATVLRLPDAHRYPHLSNIRFVALVASELICMRIFETVHAGATLLAHNVPQILAEALEARAVDAGVRIVFTADQGYEEAIDSSRRLPNYATPSDFEEILAFEQPDAAYVGLSNDNVAGSDNGESLTAWLKPRCETVLTTMSIFSPPGSRDHRGARPANSGYPRELLQQAFFYAQYRWTTEMDRDSAFSFSGKCLRLVDIIEAPGPLDPHSMVDWTNSPALPVYKTRLDSGRMFKSHKSAYWIVGMSGALGISLADWMIAKGARNIVMSSRDPRIAAEWIECHRRKGAIVTVIPCDVTDANALENAQRTIRETLPPIRGVIHGAMRLFDISIRNMTYDQLMDVTRPKVDGAIHLDRMFYETDLDFFVLTSSINTVIGNLGQANYAAANAFMCSLAAQRRKRGFRAAAVNGGAIIGAGYMEREARRAWDKIAQHNYMMRLSEEDFVQSICEAIDASRLDSPYGPEISTGLNNVPFEARNQPFWSSDPMFSILIQHQGAATDTVKEGKKAVTTSAALALELEKCETMEELHGVILRKFALSIRRPSDG